MRNKNLLTLAVLLTCLPLIIRAQSNTVIDNLLEKEKADWGQSTYLVLTAAQLIGEDTEIQEVPGAVDSLRWDVEVKESAESITLGEYSYLLMKAFDIPGGIMYQFLPGPRYAARELFYLELIDGNGNPNRTISGDEVLRILGRLLEWKEKNL